VRLVLARHKSEGSSRVICDKFEYLWDNELYHDIMSVSDGSFQAFSSPQNALGSAPASSALHCVELSKILKAIC